MEHIISDLTGVLRATFTSGDWVRIAIVVLVAFIGAMAMRNYRQGFSTSVFAMFLLAILSIIYSVATGPTPGVLSSWTGQLQSGWGAVMSMTGRTLVGYFVMFLVTISLLYTIKRIVSR